MIKKKDLIKNIIFYTIVIIVSLSIYGVNGLNSDPRVLMTNLFILAFSLVFMIIGDRYNYSLNKIFMLFYFFFFGIAPAIQYQKGIVMWSKTGYSSGDYYKTNLVVLFILIVYQSLYYFFTRIKGTKLERAIVERNNQTEDISSVKLLLIAIGSLFISLYVHKFNIAQLLIRDGATIQLDQSVGLIYSNFIRPIPAIALFLYKNNKFKGRRIEIALWMIFLLTNFPTSEARFYIAALYIPILIIYSKKIKENYLLLNKFVMIGLLVVFPFLDQVRRITSLKELTFTLDFQMFSQGHFDSYQMFMHVLTRKIITHGKQLRTAVLFFVPRTIWPEKSIGSGTLIAEQYNFYFSNISMNFFGEGYINYGYVGILLFTIALAYLNARYDKLFWTKLKEGSILNIFYTQFLGLQFFLLRGDMLSGTAFITGMFVSLLFINKFAVVKD